MDRNNIEMMGHFLLTFLLHPLENNKIRAVLKTYFSTEKSSVEEYFLKKNYT